MTRCLSRKAMAMAYLAGGRRRCGWRDEVRWVQVRVEECKECIHARIAFGASVCWRSAGCLRATHSATTVLPADVCADTSTDSCRSCGGVGCGW